MARELADGTIYLEPGDEAVLVAARALLDAYPEFDSQREPDEATA